MVMKCFLKCSDIYKENKKLMLLMLIGSLKMDQIHKMGGVLNCRDHRSTNLGICLKDMKCICRVCGITMMYFSTF